MATVSENLTTLIGIKNDIKTAIINKGVEVGDDFNSYATAIGSINSGGGSGLDYSGLGYSNNDISNVDSMLQDSINIAKEIYNVWVPSSENTTLSSISGYINNDLIIFPLIDTRYVTNLDNAFEDCISLKYMPLLNTSNVTSMVSTFEGCENLTNILQIDMSNVRDVGYMFSGSSITELPLLDWSNVRYAVDDLTQSLRPFYLCIKLTDIGGFLDVKADMDFSGLGNITKQSWINIFTNLYDWNTNPDNLNSADWGTEEHIIWLTNGNGAYRIGSDSETIAIATNKGWTLRFS